MRQSQWMSGAARQREVNEEVTLTLPGGLARQIADKAEAMHVSVSAAAVVLLTYGLKAQEEREREMAKLVEAARQSNREERPAAINALGEAIFGR